MTPTRALPLLLFFVACCLFSQSAVAVVEVRLGLLGAGPDVFSYEISVLKLALQNSGVETRLTIENLDMPQERALVELEAGRAGFNVFFTGFSRKREERFHQVDIPLTRGLLGHRIFMTTTPFIGNLSAIRTSDELREFAVIGSGTGWPDTEILASNGFHTVSSDYESLWRMLAAGRINTFNRGLHEAYVEYKQRRPDISDLAVEPTLMVRYRFDYMFYVRKEDKGLGELIENGLRTAYANGTFMKNFSTHPVIQRVMQEAKLSERIIFDLDNPLLTSRQRSVPDQYWHRY